MGITVQEVVNSLEAGAKLTEMRARGIELKESWKQEHGKDLSALANRKGESGVMIVGIKDDGALAGRNEAWAEENEEKISNHINQYLNPVQALTQIKYLAVPGGSVLIVGVENPGAVVYWNGTPYKAAGTTSAEMSSDEVMALTLDLPGLMDYSAKQETVQPEDIQADLVLSFCQRLSTTRPSEFRPASTLDEALRILRELKLLNTTTMRILFGRQPVRVVYYDASDTPTQNEVAYGLYSMVEDSTVKLVQDYSKAYIDGGGAAYDSKSLSEALANAVAHAAYFDAAGDMVVEIFPDRLTISNLCIPDSAHFANRWLSNGRYTHNRLLMEILRLAKHVDELGRGKRLIFSGSIANGQPPPIVSVEPAGKCRRWRLTVYARRDQNYLRLLHRIEESFARGADALIATALTYYVDRPFEEVLALVDEGMKVSLLEIISARHGPVFFDPATKRLQAKRWVRVLLGEGKDSKVLSHAEEEDLYKSVMKWSDEKNGGRFSPADVRTLGGLASTAAEQSLVSNLLRKWTKENKVKKVANRQYTCTRSTDFTATLLMLQRAMGLTKTLPKESPEQK